MRKTMILFLAIGFVFAMSLPALATHLQTGVTPGAGINAMAGGVVNSRHNLSSTGIHVITTATSEVCVFCHTPHHTATVAQPLWNKYIESSNFTPYTIYVPPITPVNPPQWASLACLSCHDGATTFDNLINAPGSGGFVSTGFDWGWAFTEDLGAVDDFLTSPRLVIGTDLTDDHPFSIDYSDGLLGLGRKASLRPRTTTISEIDLRTLTTNTVNGVSLAPGDNRWAVTGFISNTAVINDLLRGAAQTVECSSCHDPHYKNRTNSEIDGTYGVPLPVVHPAKFCQGDGVSPELDDALYVTNVGDDCGEEIDGLFLRRVGGNSASGVCRTCHAK